MKQLLHPSHAANILSIRPTQLLALVRKGVAPHVRLPLCEDNVRFTPSDVDALIEKHHVSTEETK
jgi:hypothetical protein